MSLAQAKPQSVSGPPEPVVELVGAGARVGGKTIWSGVDITVGHGEFVAILGPNGSGKSTLLKVLLGLQPVATGVVRILGDAPGRHNRQIGYLPQRRAFGADVRIRGVDIVALGLDGDRWGTPIPLLSRLLRPEVHRARREQVAQVIDLVGASAYAERPIGQCSGGEQQRLLIAQALIRAPRVLILDEPLDSLDVPSQAGISALIQRVCREQGVAVLLVAHDVNPILSYLDKVVYVAGGTAVAGRPAEVITADILTRLYGTPIDVLHDRSGRLVVVGQRDVPAEHH